MGYRHTGEKTKLLNSKADLETNSLALFLPKFTVFDETLITNFVLRKLIALVNIFIFDPVISEECNLSCAESSAQSATLGSATNAERSKPEMVSNKLDTVVSPRNSRKQKKFIQCSNPEIRNLD